VGVCSLICIVRALREDNSQRLCPICKVSTGLPPRRHVTTEAVCAVLTRCLPLDNVIEVCLQHASVTDAVRARRQARLRTRMEDMRHLGLSSDLPLTVSRRRELAAVGAAVVESDGDSASDSSVGRGTKAARSRVQMPRSVFDEPEVCIATSCWTLSRAHCVVLQWQLVRVCN
jgi:hypothetical protein